MATSTITGTDVRLRNVVIRRLDWDPEVDASAIGVSAHEGVVTLTGFVDNYADKLTAERIAKSLRGVRAVANDIVVRLLVEHTDEDIALAVARAISARRAVADHVQAAVHHGDVTLTGSVQWLFQKQAAEDIVRHVPGVVHVHNYVAVKPGGIQHDVKHRITRMLHLDAELDARDIAVALDGTQVVLSGTARTWAQRVAAEHAAACAPGVTHVVNEIEVTPAPLGDDVPDDMC